MQTRTRQIVVWLLAAVSLGWAMPSEINYQGTLKEKGLPADGTHQMLFRLTNQDGTQVYWSSGQMAVTVTKGLFSARLSPTGVDWETISPYMEVSVEGQLLLPREPMTSGVYALIAASVVHDAVTTEKIKDGAVTFAKLADAAVSTNKLADQSVTTAKIANSAVTTPLLASGAVTAANLDPSIANSMVPPGTMAAFGGATSPAGWLLCDGSTVTRTGAYANLFAAIQDTWGRGDGVTTFNLPDLRGRAPIGAGQGAGLAINRSFGVRVGSEAHQMSVAEMPRHSHDIIDPGHSHTFTFLPMVGTNTSSGGSFAKGGGETYPVNPSQTGITIKPVGDGVPFDLTPPSVVVNFIIKF
jgi:microcystin-dependent protein